MKNLDKILILLLFISQSIYTQEKQNNFNWEETITYIKSNLVYLNCPGCDKVKASIKDNNLNIKVDDGLYFFRVPLLKLKKVTNLEKSGMEFVTVGKNIKYVDPAEEVEWLEATFPFTFEDPIAKKNLNKKLRKLFKHLAYLADQKRNKE